VIVSHVARANPVNLDDIRKAIAAVNVFSIPFEAGVFKRERLIPRDFTMKHRGTRSLGSDDFPDEIKSVVVYAFFSAVPVDYYVRHDLTLNLLTWLKFNSPHRFVYDNYRTLRKEAAVYAGLGRIGKNRLFFSHRFGFNCKIDCVFTDAEFDDYFEFEGDHALSLCTECSECIQACTPRALSEPTMQGFATTCYSFHLSRPRSFTFQLAHTHCNDCVESCPFSNELLEKIPEEIRYRQHRWLIGGDDRELMPHDFLDRSVEEVLEAVGMTGLDAGDVSVEDVLDRKGIVSSPDDATAASQHRPADSLGGTS
jgi:formate hydrogenlyase subunit 6/NADH:ubiquinone oxidoreductase subunit I